MKICPKCNKEQEEGTVCLICGEKLVEKNDIVETNHKKKSDNNFYNRVPESSKPSSAKFVIILLIIFICFALAFVIISRRAQTVNPLISTKDIKKQNSKNYSTGEIDVSIGNMISKKGINFSKLGVN